MPHNLEETTSDGLQSELEVLIAKARAQVDLLKAKEDELARIESKADSSYFPLKKPGDENDVVKLNIGGTTYATVKSTISKQKGSYFYAMLYSGKFKPSPDGSYFVDRNPRYFDLIMDFMRNGESLDTHGLDTYEKKKLMADMAYFMLVVPKPPKAAWAWDETKKPNHATISEDGLKFTKSGGGSDWNCTVVSTEPIDRYTVKIDNRGGGSGNIMIGLVTGEDINPNGSNYTKRNVWYFYIYNGSLYGNATKSGSGYASAMMDNEYLTVVCF